MERYISTVDSLNKTAFPYIINVGLLLSVPNSVTGKLGTKDDSTIYEAQIRKLALIPAHP